jgi:hypothetical protein
MTQALYAHMNNKRKKNAFSFGDFFRASSLFQKATLISYCFDPLPDPLLHIMDILPSITSLFFSLKMWAFLLVRDPSFSWCLEFPWS